MITFAIILTLGVIVFFGHAIRNEAWRWRWYRRRRGGSWYKYRMTGELPGTTGSFWSQQRHEPHRYYDLVAEEHWKIK